jgi:hypothetical protein
VCSLTAGLTAAPRTASEAQRAAQTFIAHIQGTSDLVRRVPLKRTSFGTDELDAETAPYYLFNDADGGFIVISGSDRMRPVVAYSPSESFSAATMPTQLRAWFALLSDATQYVEQHPEAAITTAQVNSLADFAPIAPLLGAIAWDQNDPYSLDCPRRYPTGCMATALAQVMRYHRYPEHGVGSNSYTNSATSQTLAVNFAEQTYNWDLMNEVYDATATDEQRAEVAKLMFHCGVALNMSYAADNSGSTAPYYLAATVDHFGYNDLTTLQYRNMYTYDEWNRLLYAELEAGRPVLFSGQASSGGHAFVVDGYSSNGYYHVNWGWSGQYNGYYDISVLNPVGVGAGAAVSENGYSLEQSAVLQLTPQAHVGQYFSPVAGEGVLTSTTKKTTVGGTMKVRMTNLTNYTPRALSGQVYGLIEGNNQQWRCPISDISIAASGINMNTTNVNTDVTLPSDLTDGSYTLTPYFQAAGSDSAAVLRFRISAAGCFTLTVANGTVTVAKPALDLQLAASDWSFATTEYVANASSKVSVLLANNSDDNYVGRCYLELEDPYGLSSTVASDSLLHLAAGDSVRVTFSTTFASAGEWSASLAAALQNVTDNPKIAIANSATTFTVVATASAIRDITTDGTQAAAPTEVYNLMGQRVATLPTGTTLGSARLPQGVYLVGGRKVVVR